MKNWDRVKLCVLVCDCNICVQLLLANELPEICIFMSPLISSSCFTVSNCTEGDLDDTFSKCWVRLTFTKLAAECNVIQC